MGILGIVGYARLRAALTAGDTARHTLRVLQTVETVHGLLRDVVIYQRGFLLTGDDADLARYVASRDELPRAIDELRRVATANPTQAARLLQLEPLVAQRLVQLDTTIAHRRAHGLGPTAALGRHGHDDALMEAIRELLSGMADEQRRLARTALAVRERGARQTATVVILGSALAMLLLVGSVLLLRRQVWRRDRAERATRESQQRLLVTLSSIGDAVIATDTHGVVTFMNPVASALTGWSDADARGRPLAEVFHVVDEASSQRIEDPVARVLHDRAIVALSNHTVLVTPDGRQVPIDDSAAPIRGGDGDVMGVVLVFRDVTERKRAEESHQRTARAEAANQAKDEFLAVLSHELRAPLNAMLGWVRLLQRPDRSPAMVDRAVEVLERNIGTQTRVINELLDISRIVSGRLRLALEPVNLTDIVRDAVDSIRLSAEGRGLTLAATLPDGPVLGVRGDPARLQQIMGNLLTNAVKFTPPGGRIDVELAADGETARIVVRDTGEGIAPEFLPHVFERFRQADSSPSRAHGGLGIGLAIARSLAERHGGTLTAASEGVGRGATFTVTLPLATALPGVAAPPAVRDAGTTLDGLGVLLVDDDVDTLDALRLALEERGARVRTATDVATALAAWDDARPDVVVSDISMPGANGYDLVRTIRERDGVHTPAIAMTGLVAKDDRATALEAGFDEHLSKPVDPDDLIRLLGTVVRRG